MTAPVEEVVEVSLEAMPDLETLHTVCCEDVTKTICSRTIPEREYDIDEPVTCVECIEEEQKRGAGACPLFPVCIHIYCDEDGCRVRPGL